MTKFSNLNPKRHAFFLPLLLLLASLALADIGVPMPADQLQQADVVAVGTIQEAADSDGKPVFTATSILKGNIILGKKYEIDSPSAEIRHTIPYLLKLAGEKSFLLVARFDSQSQKIWPVYGTGCVWPSSQDYLDADMRTPATLKECIAFASSVLNLPDQDRLGSASLKSDDVSDPPPQDNLSKSQPAPPSTIGPTGVASKVSAVVPNEAKKESMPWMLYTIVIFATGAALYFRLKKANN